MQCAVNFYFFLLVGYLFPWGLAAGDTVLVGDDTLTGYKPTSATYVFAGE